MSESPNLDPAALERLHRLGGTTFVSKMIDIFAEYAGGKVREARAAHASGQLEQLADAVHPLKSSAGNVGAIRVQELATRLEALARQASSAPPAGLLEELEQAFAAAKAELEERQQQLKAPLAVDAATPNRQS
jgi:HPt (histidine-containing phosphotransfer) domain-containing protein